MKTIQVADSIQCSFSRFDRLIRKITIMRVANATSNAHCLLLQQPRLAELLKPEESNLKLQGRIITTDQLKRLLKITLAPVTPLRIDQLNEFSTRRLHDFCGSINGVSMLLSAAGL